MSIISHIKRWIRYRRSSISKYGVHSPFLFNLITGVLEDHKARSVYANIEAVKKEWSGKRRKLTRYDLGASMDTGKEISLGSIVRNQAVRKKYGRLLFRLVESSGAGKILELGTSVGISTSYLSGGNPDAEIYSVEACSGVWEIACTHPLLVNKNGIHLINKNFDDALKELQAQQLRFDLVFIDGDHREASTLRYFDKVMKLIHKDSLVILDDIHWSEGMEAAWKAIRNMPGVRLTIDLYGFGLVYFKKELSKQDFVLRF